MSDDKRLLYRLRNDGTSWAQGLFDEAADQIEDLECRLANARADASDCCDGYEGQISMLQEALKNTQSEHADAAGRVADLERRLAEACAALNRIARGAELQAHVMRDPLRTRGWTGAEKVADAFDNIAERARSAPPASSREYRYERRFLGRRTCAWCEQRLDQDVCLARSGKPCSPEAMAERRRECLKTYKPRLSARKAKSPPPG